MDIDGIKLNVPYAEKDDAKAVGAYWSPEERTWYLPKGVEPTKEHARWMEAPDPSPGMTISMCMVLSDGEKIGVGYSQVPQDNLPSNETRFFARVLAGYPCFNCNQRLNLLQTFKHQPPDVWSIGISDYSEAYRRIKSLAEFAKY